MSDKRVESKAQIAVEKDKWIGAEFACSSSTRA
jgi:hypothetical protein